MKNSGESLESLLGVNHIVRKKAVKDLDLDQCFLNPIIHREINGNTVYSPLNIQRVWDQIR
ncbi:hypothetical protein KIS4809_2544 [Bacillus sp. ZZV12-4809]|nr:hypothetical protein KIS4809_2544 [Bacillus sp. ZZV12-4809]